MHKNDGILKTIGKFAVGMCALVGAFTMFSAYEAGRNSIGIDCCDDCDCDGDCDNCGCCGDCSECDRCTPYNNGYADGYYDAKREDAENEEDNNEVKEQPEEQKED